VLENTELSAYVWLSVVLSAIKPYPAKAEAFAADVPAPKVTVDQVPSFVVLSVKKMYCATPEAIDTIVAPEAVVTVNGFEPTF
jgi:hypothetical protein